MDGPRADLTATFGVAYEALLLPGGFSCGIPDEPDDFRCHPPSGASHPIVRAKAYAGGLYADENGRVWRLAAPPKDAPVYPEPEPVGVPVSGMRGIIGLQATALQTCGYQQRGQVSCLDNDPAKGWRFISEGVYHLPELDCVEQLVSGSRHMCAQSCEGETYCWGENAEQQLRDNPPDEAASNRLELKDLKQISAGGHHTCALDGAGVVHCWGDYSLGVRGKRPWGKMWAKPNTVPLPGKARSISTGSDTSCATLLDGRVLCWGRGDLGASYPDRALRMRLPTQIPGLDNPDEVEPGTWQSCARTGDDVVCWGANHLAQLGQGHKENVEGLVRPLGLQGVQDIDVGNARSCAVLASGKLKCWGYLRGSDGKFLLRPTTVPDIDEAVSVTVGDDTTCVVNRAVYSVERVRRLSTRAGDAPALGPAVPCRYVGVDTRYAGLTSRTRRRFTTLRLTSVVDVSARTARAVRAGAVT